MPGFATGWAALVSQRKLFSTLLTSANPQVSTSSYRFKACSYSQTSELYAQLLSKLLAYVGDLSYTQLGSPAFKVLYEGALRHLLILNHDFPDFLAERHVTLLERVPQECAQLRSLVLNAAPASYSEVPDPFTDGLKVDRVEDMRRPPPSRRMNRVTWTVTTLASLIQQSDDLDSAVDVQHRGVNKPLVDSFVLHSAKHTERPNWQTAQSLSPQSPQIKFMDKLMGALQPQARACLIEAIIDQLRNPNTHTHFFQYTLGYLFRAGQTDATALEIQEQIVAALLRRMTFARPQPWGVLITVMEFLRNNTYGLWQLPFIKANPEVGFSQQAHRCAILTDDASD
ncbi:hypothetical protein MRB53_040094 [Persea americana]|nr:hypothetical protein MRB53_040094 [Persea americana]